MELTLIVIIGLAGLLFLMLMWAVTRYKRCPSDQLLVVYGKTGGGTAKVLHGGATFVWPVIQDYEYLDLSPISIDVDLRHALSRQNIRVNVPSRFTVGISTDEAGMLNAAERLLGKSNDQIREIAKDIIFGQLRLVVAMMDIEEINADRDKFVANVYNNVGMELKKIGLSLINVNVTDIQDESGYIEALGKEAAAKAVNEAKVVVAQNNREGAIGEAEARRDQRISVSQAEALAKVGEAKALSESENEAKIIVAQQNREGAIGEAEAMQDQRIKVANAEATAKVGEAKANAESVEGQNDAAILVAQSEAKRRQAEAEAQRKATAAEKIAKAKALEEAYQAEQEAERARAAREKATREADVIVQAEIAKRKLVIEAEAEAEQQRQRAQGEADAIFLKQEAEARGQFEILSKQAEGFQQIVQAAGGGSRDAVLMLIADKLPELVKTQVEAISNMKIDKVTVWEGGNGNGQDGNSTSKFVSGLYKSIPPLSDLFDMAGMSLPQYLGERTEEGEGLVLTDAEARAEAIKVEANGEQPE